MKSNKKETEGEETATAAWRAILLGDPFLLTHKTLHAFKNKQIKEASAAQSL